MPWSSLFPLLLLAVLARVSPLTAQDDDVVRLAEHELVRRAFAAVDRMDSRTVGTQIHLAQIPAPPFNEGRRAEALALLMREAGADSVWIDEVGNVLARRRGRTGTRTVVVDAHLDTVFPEGTDVTVRRRGDTLLAPGIGDDTRGLAAILAVLRALTETGLETEADLLFTGTVGEEGLGDLRGVKHLFRDGGPRIDAWVGVDGLSATRLVHRGLGSHRYRVTFRGPGGHSWGAFGLANPHHALGRAIAHFAEAADAYTRTGPRTSFNVGRIGGGTSVNSIPFAAWMEVDMRSISPARLLGVDSLLHGAVARALADANASRRSGDALTVDVELIGQRPSGELSLDLPFLQRAIAATRVLGLEATPGIGSTNANIPIALGVPATTVGGGGVGGDAHSLNEWWVNTNGSLAVKRILLIAVAEAGMAAPTP